MWAFDPKRTLASTLLKRRYRVNLVEHSQHDAVGGGLAVERHSEVSPYHQSDIVDWIVAHERVVAGHLAAVKIHTVRPKGDLGDPIPIFLAEWFGWVLRLKAVEPLALIIGIENFATNQGTHPCDQIVSGRDDATGRRGIGGILSRVVIGLECSRLGRSLKIGGIGGIHQGG